MDALLKDVDVDTLQVRQAGQRGEEQWDRLVLKGYVMALLLSMTTMIYGMNVARSVIQEKTSRIFEVMLAIAKPSDMLAGKLIGVGAVGLTQIGIWVVAGCVDRWASRLRHRSVRARCDPFLMGGGGFVSGLLRAWIPAVCIAVCGAGGHLRNRAGTADVHAAGRVADLDELLADMVVINDPNSALVGRQRRCFRRRRRSS